MPYDSPAFRSFLNVGQCSLGNHKSDDNFSLASPCGPYWWLKYVTLVRPPLLDYFAVSCPCANPTLSTHWILIIVICIKFALCYPIGSSEEVASQRTSWFLISSSWCLCCTSSYFFPLLFINKCKQIKRCLGDQWHMFKLGQREARLLLSYFHDQLATSSSLLVHFMIIALETRYLSWGELMHLYITVFFSSKAFDFRIFSLTVS